MSMTRGRCTNFDYCSAAEARRDIDVPIGQDFICPECGKPLKAPPIAAKQSGLPVVPVLIGVGALGLLGAAAFLGMQFAGGGKPAPAAAPAAQLAPPPSAPTPAPQTAAAPSSAGGSVLFRLSATPAIGSAAAIKLAAAYLSQIGDTDVRDEAGSSPTETNVVGLRGDRREVIAVSSVASAAGLAALQSGAADAAITARRILQNERDALAPQGDLTSASAEHLLGLDALAVVVNNANFVGSLSRDQVRAIYTGAVHNWSEVGGAPGEIHAYDLAPGHEFAVTQSVAVLANATPAASVKAEADPAQVAAAVAADPLAIGLVDLVHIGGLKAISIADTGATPETPTNPAAIASEAYPFAFRTYLYVLPGTKSPIAQRFAEFAQGSAGQAIVEQNGLISQSHKAAPAAAVDDSPAAKFKALIGPAKRLAIDFRFDPNSTDLDLHEIRDVDRVLNYLLSAHMTSDHVILVGFADTQGDPAANQIVSKKRADAVAKLFIQRGQPPGKVAGFGSALPVADNAKDTGRDRNRRVEVYILP